MVASLSFRQIDRQAHAIGLTDVKTIIYEDNTGNKYTFGVDNTNVFNIFKYQSQNGNEIDYSATATNFITGGAIAALLNIGTSVDAIQTKTAFIPDNFNDNVAAIKAKTDNMPDDLEDKLDSLAKSADVNAIKTKTDTMPANLETELGKLATSASLSTLDGKVDTIKTEIDKITAIGTNIGEIKTKTDNMPDDLEDKLDSLAKSADVNAIKTKTDTMPANLETELGKLATSASLSTLDGKVDTIKTEIDKITAIGTNIGEIKTKTDNMPADLKAELIKLTTIANTLNGSPGAAEAAKAVLESSFKKAITDAGADGSNWLKNEVKEIMSQPSFEIPMDSSAPLSWDF